MPPAPKRNRCVVLFDLNSKNERQLYQALFKIYSYYYFKDSKNLVNLILVNCEKTGNRGHDKIGNRYRHILEINKEPLPYDPTFIHSKIEVKAAEGSNWKEALRVAIQIIQEDGTPNVITNQILYLTDLTCSCPSEESLKNISYDLLYHNIFLYIVGPEVKFPKPISNFEEMPKIMMNISFKEKNDNLAEAKQLIDGEANVIISDVKRGIELFLNYKNPTGKQPWSVPLTVGTKITFPVGTFKLMDKDKGIQLVPSLKTPGYGSQTVFASAEDSTKIYSEDDVRRGLSRHGKFISVVDNKMFKSKTERCFELVFITKTDNIPEYMLKGPGSYTVIEDKTLSPEAFRCLLLRLQEEKCCLIAKKVYNKGTMPTYMVLIPNSDKNLFRAIQLPYDSEVPFEWMEQKPQKSEKDVSEEAINYLDSITIDSPKCALNCSMTPNVVSCVGNRTLLNMGADKLLKESLSLNQVDYDAFATGISADVGKDLRDQWPSRAPTKIEEESKDDDLESDHDDYF